MVTEAKKQITVGIPIDISEIGVPKFRDLATMTHEQLTDPDYRLKQLAKLSGGKFTITCSKCHHCR